MCQVFGRGALRRFLGAGLRTRLRYASVGSIPLTILIIIIIIIIINIIIIIIIISNWEPSPLRLRRALVRRLRGGLPQQRRPLQGVHAGQQKGFPSAACDGSGPATACGWSLRSLEEPSQANGLNYQ